MKYVIKVTDIQDAIQQHIRPIVAKDLNNTMFVSTKMPPLMKTIFHYSDGTTSESSDTVITKSSYESQIPEGESLTGIEIGNNVTSIGDEAFRYCTTLSSVQIPNSVTSIGEGAFRQCEGLTSVEIPNSITSIEWNVFRECSSLTSVTIPNSVTSIGSDAFSDCSSLTSVTIPNSVTYIGDYAFLGCSSLTSINVDINNLNYYSVDGVLFNKDKTTLVVCPGGKHDVYTIPNSVTSIGRSAFFGCYYLTSVTIPNSVTSIEYEAFRQCSSLTSITIPNSVTSIGDMAFFGCTETSIICEATNPPTLGGTYTFVDTNNCPIYVPAESVEAYKAAEKWSEYAFRIQAIQ